MRTKIILPRLEVDVDHPDGTTIPAEALCYRIEWAIEQDGVRRGQRPDFEIVRAKFTRPRKRSTSK